VTPEFWPHDYPDCSLTGAVEREAEREAG
jgi:hypothetical protein